MTASASVTGVRALNAFAGLFRNPIGTTRSLVVEHGTFVRLNTSPAPTTRRATVHLARAEYAEAVLKSPPVFRNGGILVDGKLGSLHNKLRHGFFGAWGDEYDHYLKAFGPHFKRKIVDDMSDVIAATVRDELDGWKTGELVNATDHFDILMKKLASRALFKDTDEPVGLHTADMVGRHARLAGVTPRSILSARFGYWLNTPLHARAEKAYHAVLDWAATRQGLPPSRDLLSALANGPDETGSEPLPERVAAYGWILIGAANDTSTSVLSWLLVFLATHPDVADRLHRELVSAPFDVTSDVTALMELPYLNAVIKEGLRLIPPAPIQRRKAMTDTEICGHEVARRSQVLLSAWMVNRDSDIYPDPDRFDPDRWLGTNRTPYEWLTFSAGPRRCLGIWFAYAFLKTTLANVLVRWRPEIPDGTRVGMKVAVTVRPVPGIHAYLRPQDGNFRRSSIDGALWKHLRRPD